VTMVTTFALARSQDGALIREAVLKPASCKE
jgi:hypothetical protein